MNVKYHDSDYQLKDECTVLGSSFNITFYYFYLTKYYLILIQQRESYA